MIKLKLYEYEDEIDDLIQTDISIVDADTIIINAKSKEKIVDEETGVTYVVEHKDARKSMPSLKKEYKERKLPKAMEDELRNLYGHSIVNDYGNDDDYHLSEEVKEKRNKFYSAFSRLRRFKRKYNKLDEYIRVYRIVYDCIRLVAEDQKVFETQKFIDKVVTGKIKIEGLIFPKYIGKDRKRINWEYIAEFVVDETMDINILFEDPNVDAIERHIDSLDEDEKIDYLLGSRLVEYCEKYSNTDPLYRDDYMAEIIDEYDSNSKKEYEIIGRYVKDFAKTTKRKRDIEKLANIYGMDEDDFDQIAKQDKKRKTKSEHDFPEFKGSIFDDDAYNKYLYDIEEYEFEHGYRTYRGKNVTNKEYNDMVVMEIFENGGINTRKLLKYREDTHKLKQDAKKYKKMEKKLRNKLMKLEKKKKDRKEILSPNKNKKKKKKKNKTEKDYD